MKILFSDFDGTLIDNQQEISSQNKEKMRQLQQAGHLIAICTGRNLLEFQKDNQFYDFPFDYIVLNNGGHIVDKHFQTLYENVISHDVGVDILEHTLKYPDMWSYFFDGEHNYSYKDGQTYNHGVVGQPQIDVDYIEAFHQASHFQIICFHQDNKGIDMSQQCFNYIQLHHSQNVEACFNQYFVDVVPSGCSKGEGMKHLLSLIHQDIDSVYAIGDSYNDLSMIKAADYGYTFDYAHDDIKKETVNHVHYVYEVIDHMLEGEVK